MTPAPARPSGWTLLCVGLLLVLSIDYQRSFFGPGPFPLNDGALFLAFARAIAEAGFALPDCVTYNRACIPLAYPPLSFYAVAALSELGLPLIAVVKWYPLAVTAAYMALSLVLAWRLMRCELALLLTAALFLFSYRSFEFMIMGGGVSRATGGLFMVLALLSAESFARRLRPLPVVLCGVATGCAILSHLEWGIAAAGTVCLLALCRAPGWRAAAVGIAGTAVVAAATIAPWVVAVLGAHGPGPFRNASATSEWNPLAWLVRLMTLGVFPLALAAPCVLGAVVTLRRREPFWLLAVLLASLVVPRSHHYIVALPAAALAATGIAALAGRLRPPLPGAAEGGGARRLARLAAPALLAFVLVAYQTAMNPAASRRDLSLEQLSPDAVAAMDWASAHLPHELRFAVVTGEPWYADEVAEWFPLLTPFESVTTAQGAEWLPDRAFWRRIGFYDAYLGSLGCGPLRDAVAALAPAAEVVLDAAATGCFGAGTGDAEIYRNDTVRLYRLAAGQGG